MSDQGNGNGITITINADTKEALARMKEFFGEMNEGMDRLGGIGEFLEEIGGKLAVLFTVGAIVEFTREAINAAEALGKISSNTGISIALLSSLREEANKTRAGFEAASMGLEMFSRNLGSAMKSGGQALQPFREMLGIDAMRQFSSGAMSVDQVLKAVIEHLGQMPDGPRKAAIASEMFGREWRDILPALERAKDAGHGIIDEAMVKEAMAFNVAVREIKDEFEAVFVAIARKILPALKEIAEGLGTAVKSGKGLAEGIASGFDKSMEYVARFAATLAAAVAQALVEAIPAALHTAWDSWKAGAQSLVAGLDEVGIRILQHHIDMLAAIRRSRPLTANEQADLTTTQEQMKLAGHVQEGELAGSEASRLKAFHELAESVMKGITGAIRGASDMWRSTAPEEPARKERESAITPRSAHEQEQEAFGEAMKAEPQAPQQTEESKRLIQEIDKAWAEATKGRLALLDAEEAAAIKKIQEEVLDQQAAEEAITKIKATYAAKRREVEKQAVMEVDRAWAESTKGKLALLQVEEDQTKEKLKKEGLARQTELEEMARIEMTYAAKRRALQQEQQEAEEQIALAKIQGRRQIVEKDADLTKEQRKEKLLELLKAELKLLKEAIELDERRLRDENLSPEAKLLANKQLQDTQQRKAETEQGIRTNERSGTWGGEWGQSMKNIQDQWQGWARETAQVFEHTFNAAFHSISNGITGLVMGTQKWGQALRTIRISIVTALVQGIVEMGVQWVLTHVIMAAVTKGFHLLMIALGWERVAQSNAQEAAKAPALAANAASASAGSWGMSATIGIVALIAMVGLAIAALGGAFAEGGRPPVGKLSLVGERGPELFVPDQPGMILPAHMTQQVMAGGGGGGTGSATVHNDNRFNIGVFHDKQMFADWARSREGRGVLVDVYKQHASEIKKV